MKLRNLFILFLLPILAMAQGHLIFTEVVLQPSTGEYVKIKNPTASAISLDNYYITDATDTTNGKYYYKLADGADYWSGSGSDFIARFPAMSLAAGESITLGLGRDSDYQSEYGELPDLYLKGSGNDTMRYAVDGVKTIGASPNAKLDNTAETLVLFTWDGSAATVQDVDYLLWGNTSHGVNKSGVATYLNDTPVTSQASLPVHIDGEKLARIDESEGSETTSGGNGITGNDETSENLGTTWQVTTLASSRPVLSNVVFDPTSPNENDTLHISATVVDVQGLSSVECVYTFDGTTEIVDMPAGDEANSYALSIAPLGATGTFTYYVRAENTLGLKDSTLASSKSIEAFVETQSIAYLRNNFDTLEETTVTVTAVVTVEMGLINTYASYIQDDSGRGIYVFGSAMSGFARGTIVEVTGTLSQYNDSKQIKDVTAVAKGTTDLPAIAELSNAALNNNFMELEGTLVTVKGQVTDRADGIGGGSNITIDDGNQSLTLRIWDSTNLLSDATADSLLQSGNAVEVTGIVGFYSNSAQMTPAYASDIVAWTDGEPGAGNVSLNVAPYPFVPQLGETIQYTYEYPDEARVIIRVYDAAGRYITTLTDEYHGVSWSLEKNWNGRDELNRSLAPGTYLMHMEVIERSTGKVTRLAQPVVIAIKN